MKKLAMLAVFVGASGGLPQTAGAEEFAWPARKPGQWELEMKTSKEMPAVTVQLCLDAATDKGMMQMGMGLAKSMCPDQKIAREGEKIVIDSKCQVAGVTVAGRTEISGDFQSEYKMVSKADVSGVPGDAGGKTDIEHVARWKTATCGDGMVPGDMLMPGGIKMNMKQMMGMMESLGKPNQP